MSSTSGLGQPTNLNIIGTGLELPNGATVDVATPEGTSAAQSSLSAEAFQQLVATMEARGYRLEGERFVEHDSFGTNQSRLNLGQDEVRAQMSASDEQLIRHTFGNLGMPAPHWEQADALRARVDGSAEFGQATQAMSQYLANPTDTNQQAAVSAVGNLASAEGEMNVYDLLFLVFRESIHETNQDRAYFLSKIQMFNKIAEGLSDYLGDLVDASQELSEKAKDKEDPSKESIEVDVRSFDLKTTDSQGKVIEFPKVEKTFTRDSLNTEIKNVESSQETIRNQRQMASTAFQNFDQKMNQLYNLMSSVLKTTSEMRSGTVRNML